MTKEQLLKKEEITKQDLFDYFKVRSYSGLEAFLSSCVSKNFDDIEINDGELYYGFSLIFKQLVTQDFNPIQEKIMLYSVVMKSVYGFDLEDFSLLTSGLGVFRTAYILDQIFSENEIGKYYFELYNRYIDMYSNMGLMIKLGVEDLIKFIDKKLEGFDAKNIEPYAEQIGNFIKDINKQINK